MRKAALAVLVVVASGSATNAQLSVTPRVGFEQAFTRVQYNNTSCISPMGANGAPQVGARIDYLFNSSHGPFAGVATNRSIVTYQFTNPETGDKAFTSSQGDWKMRFEAGYQYSSKPIALGKTTKQAVATPAPVASRCGARLAQAKAAPVQKAGMNLRIQPFAGMAYIPGTQTGIRTVNSSNGRAYEYSAGNWNTAVIAGVNFAVAKGNVNKFVVGLHYLQGIGNMDNQTLITSLENKQTNTQVSSSLSAWNITIGMPLSFTKSTVKKEAPAIVAPVKKVETTEKKSCGYYQKRCGW